MKERWKSVPNWRVHLEIAKKVNEQLRFNNEDYNLFLLGNIAPDINNGYIVEGISHIYDHGHTHLYNAENTLLIQIFVKNIKIY